MEYVRLVKNLEMESAQPEQSESAGVKRKVGVIPVANTQEREEVLDCEICCY